MLREKMNSAISFPNLTLKYSQVSGQSSVCFPQSPVSFTALRFSSSMFTVNLKRICSKSLKLSAASEFKILKTEKKLLLKNNKKTIIRLLFEGVFFIVYTLKEPRRKNPCEALCFALIQLLRIVCCDNICACVQDVFDYNITDFNRSLY